tara:strand:- start:205 stop:606 length:402 start_codon:yes stop_codon:yes gene_type:complete
MRNAPLNYVNLPQQNKRGLGLKGLTKKIGDKISEGIDNVKDNIAGELDFKSYKKQNKSVMQEYPDFRAEDLYRANVQPSDTIVSRTSIRGKAINAPVLNQIRSDVRRVGLSGGNYAVNKDLFKLTRKNYLNKQ